MVKGQRIRVGIIGCGAITESAHLSAVLKCPLVELVGISDSNTARLYSIERTFGLRGRGYPDYRQLLPRIDAAILALPNHLHASVGTDFLEAGVHVLCEKPLATSVAECEQLCSAADENKAELAVGYVTRFWPSTKMLKRLIETNFLGPIEYLEYEFGTEGGWAPISGYTLSRATSGGGVLVVSGSHFIDRMLYLFPGAQIVSYEDDSRGGIEANCLITVTLRRNSSAIPGRIALSKTHRLANRLRIKGATGVVEMVEGQTLSLTYLPTDSVTRHELFPRDANGEEPDWFVMQLEDFVRAIQNGTRPMVDGIQGSMSVAFIERCYGISTHIEEPWCDATIDRLRTALPARSRAGVAVTTCVIS